MESKTIINRDLLPDNFDNLSDFWRFWDEHSTVDYEDLMEVVEVEVELSSSKLYFPVAKDLLHGVREQARKQGVSPETLVNLWLQEKLHASA